MIENEFHKDAAVRYRLGEFNPLGWVYEESYLYRTLMKFAIWMFPNKAFHLRPPLTVFDRVYQKLPLSQVTDNFRIP